MDHTSTVSSSAAPSDPQLVWTNHLGQDTPTGNTPPSQDDSADDDDSTVCASNCADDYKPDDQRALHALLCDDDKFATIGINSLIALQLCQVLQATSTLDARHIRLCLL